MGTASRLSEASIRINDSIDFDTALQGVLDSARALTQARCSVRCGLKETPSAASHQACALMHPPSAPFQRQGTVVDTPTQSPLPPVQPWLKWERFVFKPHCREPLDACL